MTCGAEDLLRYEFLKHDERELSSTIEERPQFASCNGYSLNWLPDVNQKWRPTPNPQNPLLKSDKLPRLGKSHEPDRKGVERCWLLLRSHFEPIEPPPTIDEAEEKRKQEVAEAVTLIHRFVRRFCHVKMAVDAFLKPPPLEAPKSPVSDGGPSDAFVSCRWKTNINYWRRGRRRCGASTTSSKAAARNLKGATLMMMRSGGRCSCS